jgi:hypothetical protein
MEILKKGDCEHCGRLYRYSLWHSGFGDNTYAYCDECGMLAILNRSNPQVVGFPKPSEQYGEIEESWEPFLQPCACGGHFRKGASPRCLHCNHELSPSHAAAHLEQQSVGTFRGWKWQNNWTGVYCIAMDDPEAPGNPRQMVDPVTKPEAAKVKSRWSLLFSSGR